MASQIILKNGQDQEFSITHPDNVGAININSNELASKDYVTTTIQPTLTGGATLNGTTNNIITMTNIVLSLRLEVGDVIRVNNNSGYDKLHTVENLNSNNSIIVNYEHAGNRGNGSLKLPNVTMAITVTRIAKWYNAPIGLGQAWVATASVTQNTVYPNTTNRAIIVKQYSVASSAAGMTEWEIAPIGSTSWVGIGFASNSAGSASELTIPSGFAYRFTRANNQLIGQRVELR